MLEAVILFANCARERNEFLLFAVLERTAIGVDFRLLRFAKFIDVSSDGDIRRNVPRCWDRLTAHGTDRHLDIFPVGRRAGMCSVAEVLRAENFPTSVAFHRKEIELVAKLLRTMFTQMREFHLEVLLKFTSALQCPLVPHSCMGAYTHVYLRNDVSSCCVLNINTAACGRIVPKLARSFQYVGKFYRD